MLQIVGGDIPPVGSLNPTIPGDVQNIVAKMMHTDRNQRFQSAEDLIHALKRADTQPATGERPVPSAAAAPGAAAGPTVALDDSRDKPTVKMSPEGPGAEPTGPTEAVDEKTVALPKKTKVVADQVEAIPAQQTVPASKPAPAADVDAPGGGNRGMLFGLAALVVVTLALAFAAWQFMGWLGADEAIDPEATTRQAALSAGGTNADNDAATTGNDAAQTDASGNQTSVDSAAGNDTTPEPETPAATVPGAATTPQPPPQANAGTSEQTGRHRHHRHKPQLSKQHKRRHSSRSPPKRSPSSRSPRSRNPPNHSRKSKSRRWLRRRSIRSSR